MRLSVTTLLSGALCLAGCATPSGPTAQQQLASLKPGESTQSEVIERLGRPDSQGIEANGTVDFYYSANGHVSLPFVGALPSGHPNMEVRFAPDGTVTEYSLNDVTISPPLPQAVISLPDPVTPPLLSASDQAARAAAGQRMFDAINPATALDGVIAGPMSAATPPASDAVKEALQGGGPGTVLALNEFPGALVCPDFDTTSAMFTWINDAYQDSLANALSGGQAEILHRSPTGPDLQQYGCAIIPTGTPIKLARAGMSVPVVQATVNGQLIEGVTLAAMVGEGRRSDVSRGR